MLPFYLGRNLHTFKATQSSVVAVWGIITNRPCCQSTWQKEGKSRSKTSSSWGLWHKVYVPLQSSALNVDGQQQPTHPTQCSVAQFWSLLSYLTNRLVQCCQVSAQTASIGGLGLDLVQRPEGQREPRLVHATGSWPCQCLIPTEPIRQQRWDQPHSDETTFREIFWWQTISNKGLNIAISVSALIRRDNFTKHNIVSYFYRSLATLTLYWIMRSHCGLILLKSGSDRTGGDQINEVC